MCGKRQQGFTLSEIECVASSPGLKLHLLVALTLVRFKAHWQTPKCRWDVHGGRCALMVARTCHIVPEQKSAAEDQQCEQYWGPSPGENSSQPNAIYHHTTLRDPGFMEKKYREKLAPDA